MTNSLPARCEVVVIGAGVGGLTSAALLAKAGVDLCVVEMAERPGGYLSGFERGGFVFDTSTHWLNQCGPGGFVRNVLDLLGPDSPETPPLERIRRYKGDSFDYLLTRNPDLLCERLAEDFPGDGDGVRGFFALARELAATWIAFSRLQRSSATMGWPEKITAGLKTSRPGLLLAKYAKLDTERALGRFFSPDGPGRIFPSEKNILSCLMPIAWAYNGDYQQPPAGGGKQLPLWLCGVLREWGTNVFCGHRVDRILLEGNRAVGVRVRNAVDGADAREIRCDFVVAACDIESIYRNALPEGAVSKRFLRRLEQADLYESAVTISLGLDTDPRALGLGEEVVFLSRCGLDRPAHNDSDPDHAAISVLAPSVRDASLAPAGKGTMSIQVNANIRYGDFWKAGPLRARTPDYRAFKEQYAATILERVERSLAPGLGGHIEHRDVATPLTYLRYTGNRDGSIMGARASFRNIRSGIAHYRSPIDNLLVGGQWAEYGGGVPMAVRAGVNSALLILRRKRPEAFGLFSQVIDHKRAPSDCVSPALRTLNARALER